MRGKAGAPSREDAGRSGASANPLRARLERPPQRKRHPVELVARVLDAVPARAERERGRAAVEARITAAERAGRDEAAALVAAVACKLRPPHGIAAEDVDAVLQPRPVRKVDDPLERPVERELAVEAERPR